MPDWLDKEAWEAYCEMRRAMGKRAPFTALAEKRTIHDLEKLEAQGFPNGEVLWQSVTAGYRGVFPIKGHRPEVRKPVQHQSFQQQDAKAKQARIAEMTGGLLGSTTIDEVTDGQLKLH